MDTALEITERKFRYPDGKCFDINVTIGDDGLGLEEVVDLTVWFTEDENSLVDIKITDPHRDYFLSDKFSFSGDRIRKHLDDTHEPSFDTYRVEVQQFNEQQEDQQVKCKFYGKNETFKQCVQDFVEEKYLKEFECVPPWFTENIVYACNELDSEQQWKNMSDLIFPTLDAKFLKVSISIQIPLFHLKSQDCLAPCTHLEINSREIRTIDSEKNGIKVIFDPTVRVFTSTQVMDLKSLISNVGGCLGLTVGYSILQLGENIFILVQLVLKKSVNWIVKSSIQ